MTERADQSMVRTHLESADLAEAWNRSAPEFVAWARTPDHDSYWHFHRDLFLEIVPPPGARTLDLGCGEGRLSRDLKRLGHHVTGVDRSPVMLAAARAADADIETHLADAASLPFEDVSFDLVVAFMSLQDIEDFAGAIGEAARVAEHAGRLCLAIVHPLNSAGLFADRRADSPFTIRGSYLGSHFYADELARDGLELTFVSAHRPLRLTPKRSRTRAYSSSGSASRRSRTTPCAHRRARAGNGYRSSCMFVR